ncbi:hypothetical protein [Aporhodopirellula aestuarii]|nr:hypothetical protein [Aporhodopirellula aestuarii]
MVALSAILVTPSLGDHGDAAKKEVFTDNFSSSHLDGRDENYARGQWTYRDNVATAVCDPELYAKHKNHGPMLSWPVTFKEGQIEFEMKATDCQRVVFTLNGDGHVFRVTLADETDACQAGASRVPTRLIAWETKSSKQNKGDTIKPKGLPDLPAIQDQWVRLNLDIEGEHAKLSIGDFQTSLDHPALARDKSAITLTFAHGSLAVRNYRMAVR